MKLLKMAILMAKITAVQNEAALSYHKVRGLHFLAVAFTASMFSYCAVPFARKYYYALYTNTQVKP